MNNKEERFKKLFDSSRAKLINVAYGVVKNRELAEDVLQDAYIKAWKKFDEYDQSKKFINWMTTIVTNAGIDFNRSRAKYRNTYSLNSVQNYHIGDKGNKTAPDFVDKSTDIQKQIEKAEMIGAVKESINQLPNDLRDIMILFFEGNSYTEISEITKYNLNTVRARVHRAKKILRKTTKNIDTAIFFG
jgi:RNA polymerase sigma-70 factor (ECF subfamily)